MFVVKSCILTKSQINLRKNEYQQNVTMLGEYIMLYGECAKFKIRKILF